MKIIIQTTCLLFFLCSNSKFYKLDLENTLLNKNQKKIIYDSFNKIRKEKEYLSINTKGSSIFFEGADKNLKQISYILKKIDKSPLNLHIEMRYGLINKNSLNSVGFDSFGLYFKNVTRFGFSGLSGTPTQFLNDKAGPFTNLYPGTPPFSIASDNPGGLYVPITFGGKNIMSRRLTGTPILQENLSEFRTIATLTAIVQDRKSFKIQSGNQIPYYTLNNRFNYNRLAQIYELNYINDGATVTIEPVIKGECIKFKIYFEDKSLDNATLGNIISGGTVYMELTPPLYNVIRLNEVITLKDGETLCLFQSKDSSIDNVLRETNINFPPLLKKLFSYSSDIDMSDYSFILITPKIIRE